MGVFRTAHVFNDAIAKLTTLMATHEPQSAPAGFLIFRKNREVNRIGFRADSTKHSMNGQIVKTQKPEDRAGLNVQRISRLH